MSDYERLQRLIKKTDELISQEVTDSDSEFTKWKTSVQLFISSRIGDNSIIMQQFKKIRFAPIIVPLNGSETQFHRDCAYYCRSGLTETKAMLEAYLDELGYSTEYDKSSIENATNDSTKIFIVHGHDGELKQSVARIIEKQSIKPIILSEQANTGFTIIEKFEKNSDVGCAICLFTADDLGRTKSESIDKPRTRQNVVFETGYFMGKLGRDHVVILSDKGIDIPSDLSGVVYTDTNNWQVDLLKELNKMGYDIDLNKMFD